MPVLLNQSMMRFDFGRDFGTDAVARQEQEVIGSHEPIRVAAILRCVDAQSSVTARAVAPPPCSRTLSICGFFSIVSPISSRPLSRQCLRKGSMVERDHAAVGPADFLALRSMVSVALAPRSASSMSFFRSSRRHGDRQDAVLEAVVVEDVGERGRDHAADAEIEQRPGRMLARRAAAEIVAGDEDLAPCDRPAC